MLGLRFKERSTLRYFGFFNIRKFTSLPYPCLICKGKTFFLIPSSFPIVQDVFRFWILSFVILKDLELLLGETEMQDGRSE